MLKLIFLCTVALACVTGCASETARSTQTAAAAAVPPNCTRTTASRIPPGPHDCQNAPGRTYTGNDIDNTGQTNAAGALGMLDPAITPR